MKLYEFEGKILLKESGIPVPRGSVVTTVEEAKKVASTIGYPVAIKSQTLGGGRGKSGGIRFAGHEEALTREAGQLFSSGMNGEKIERLLIEEKISVAGEFYAGITLDPQQLQPLLMISPEGGMDIEEGAGQHPDRLFKRPLHPLETPSLAQMTDLAIRTGLQGEQLFRVADILLNLVQAYFRYEAITVEINPLILSEGRGLFAADAKFELDDSALKRTKGAEMFVRKEEEMGPLEKEAQREGIAYVRMSGGNIGLISGGAGLGMATMDMISIHGGRPANFLDLGGDATEEKTAAALRIVLKTPGVEGILMNAFGGINNCERMAEGMVRVVDELRPRQTMVVKMRGHSQDEGWALLESRQIPIVKLGTTEEAVLLLIEKMEEREAGRSGHPG